MEKFVCDLLGIPEMDLRWLYTLNQKYHVLNEHTSIFDRILETDFGMDDSSGIIYDNSFNTYWAEAAMLTAIIRNEVDETFDLAEDISTVDELIITTNNGENPSNAYLDPTDVDEKTLKKFSILIKELSELLNKFHSLTLNNTTFKYASKTRRR